MDWNAKDDQGRNQSERDVEQIEKAIGDSEITHIGKAEQEVRQPATISVIEISHSITTFQKDMYIVT